jgi:hypothetical protein
MPSESELIAACREYLRDHYGEELVSYDILSDKVDDDGDGNLKIEAVVRTGGPTSRWHKTFSFHAGDVTDMKWRYLG